MVRKSYAKLNLHLAVLGRRRDGFHELFTIFERISLYDSLSFTLRGDSRIVLSCRNKAVPTDQTNLCYKAARLLQEKYRVKYGVTIKIVKRIPVGAGLGGGSSNAATTLLALNSLWKLGLPVGRLAVLGSQIGSDVSFFLHDIPWAQATGRGEVIRPLKECEKIRLWHLVAVPAVHVSTPLIYKAWDKLGKKRKKARLTSLLPDAKILLSAFQAGDFSLAGLLFNNLEPVTLRLYPQVGLLKKRLVSLGAQQVQMSGSGSSVFAIAGSYAEAKRLRRRLRQEKRRWPAFVVRTASR